MIPRRNCDEQELNTEISSHFKLDNNTECFDFQKNQTMRGYFYSEIFSFFEVTLRINAE